MTNTFKPWPPDDPFPESTQEIDGGGTHFPSSAGDRERGKFRPGSIALTTTVAVVNDDGSSIGSIGESADETSETVYLLRLIVQGLSLLIGEDLFGEDFSPDGSN